MNKAGKIATGVLAVLLLTLFGFYWTESPAHVQWEIEHNPTYAPNVMHRIQPPPPTNGGESSDISPEDAAWINQIASVTR